MRQKHIIVAAGACLLSACAAATPRELVDARAAYMRASSGQAAQDAPAELQKASEALEMAEKSFKENGSSFKTKDLAYVALRRAEISEAMAATIVAEKQHAQEEQHAAREQQQQNRATAEDKADRQLESEAQEALLKVAGVREDERGYVITMSGSVMFSPNQTTLLPLAKARLDELAQMLVNMKDRRVVIEGYTDSSGTEKKNQELSQRRAEVVRDYLVSQNVEPDRVIARGLGESSPIADNKTAAGRANNRRVEIVVERESHATKY